MAREVANIVFTKNRPLQLEGYLRSLYGQYKSELFQTYVIYKEELFNEQYEDVFSNYREAEVIRETNFHRDLIGLIERIDTEYVLFGIDDVAFFDDVDFSLIKRTFESAEKEIFGFTLRFAPESLKQNGENIRNFEVDGQKVYSVDWTKGQSAHTRYPFELCCSFYKTAMVKEILKNVVSDNPLARSLFSPGSGFSNILLSTIRRKVFKCFGFIFSPNTLESWVCRWCQENPEKLPKFTYFQKLCASAIQVNMVNTSTKGIFEGKEDNTVETLNEKYQQGYRLDLDYIKSNRPKSLACGKECFKLAKIK
jgi:hypothetical protein